MKSRALYFLQLIVVLLLLPGFSVLLHAQETCTETYGSGTQRFSLATGSPGELGLLKALAEEFNREKKASLCWVKAGSGDSLKTLPVLPRHKTLPRPTEKSRNPNRLFLPAETIPGPIKKNWISGRHRA